MRGNYIGNPVRAVILQSRDDRFEICVLAEFQIIFKERQHSLEYFSGFCTVSLDFAHLFNQYLEKWIGA